MEKELRVRIDFYLTMREGETEEQAKERFYDLMRSLEGVENQESSFQAYEFEVE